MSSFICLVLRFAVRQPPPRHAKSARVGAPGLRRKEGSSLGCPARKACPDTCLVSGNPTLSRKLKPIASSANGWEFGVFVPNFSLVKVNRREHKRSEHIVLIHHELRWLIAISVIDGDTGPHARHYIVAGRPLDRETPG